MSDLLRDIVSVLASPWGAILAVAWILGSIWAAYRRLKEREKRGRRRR